jgi:DNA invertase Pin-like site-specific DNA recombinase
MRVLSDPKVGEVYLLGYSRISNQDREKEISIDIQNDRLTRAGVHRLYWDQLSGDDDDRPDYQLLLADAQTLRRTHLVEVVACRLDRLGRNDRELERVIEWFESLRIKFRALDGGYYGTQDLYDWMRLKQESMMAQYWIRQTSMTRRRRMEEKRKKGQPTVGRPTVGYRYNTDKTSLELDPETAPIVRSWFDMYLSGASMREVSRASGISPSGVRNLLTNPVYRGHLAYTEGGRTRKQITGRENMPKQIKYNTHPAIITNAEWRIIQNKIDENRRLWGHHFVEKRYPLQGLVFCQSCDRRMTTRDSTNGKSPKRYRHLYCRYDDCNSKFWIIYSHVEAKAQEAIVSRSDELANLIVEPVDVMSPRVLEIQDQIQQLKSLLHINGIREAIEELEYELEQLNSVDIESEVKDLENLAYSLKEGDWSCLDEEERRHLYHILISKIYILNKEITEVMLRF